MQILATGLSLAGVVAAGEAGNAPSGSEANYLLALKAYRGEATAQQLATLEETDPGPSLYLDSERPSERALVRLFATLPDEEHARLRKDGLLKWKVAALPELQRGWAGDLASFLETLGEGPFPVKGRRTEKRSTKGRLAEPPPKADPDATQTGFVRVDVPGQDQPSYSWWISSPNAKRTAWLTVVHAVGLATREWQVAHQARLEEIEEAPNTPAVAEPLWRKFRESRRIAKATKESPAENAPRFFEDAVYSAALKVYGGRRGIAELDALKPTDPDLESRLKTNDLLAQTARTMFVRLSDRDHQTLRTQGVVRWYSQELSKDQARLLGPAIEELNQRAAQSGNGDALYGLGKFSGTCVGFSILAVPGAEGPVLSWWIRSRTSPNPTWVTLINTGSVKAPGYYRAHLVAIGGVM